MRTPFALVVVFYALAVVQAKIFEEEGEFFEVEIVTRRRLQDDEVELMPLAGDELAYGPGEAVINEPCYTHSGMCQGCGGM